MNNIEANLKRWIEYIQTENLEKVTVEIQGISRDTVNERTNKQIFKLLLFLSHTADKCDKKICATGKDIYSLAKTLCSLLIDIPDSSKYVSSLYHITWCLLTMKMYKEASKLCIYVKREYLPHSDPYVQNVLLKFTCLWNNATNNLFNTITHDSQSSIIPKELKRIMKYELEVIEIVCHKNSLKYILGKLSQYMDKLALMRKKLNCSITELHQFLVEYLMEQRNMTLDLDEKYSIFRHALQILTKMMVDSINQKDVGNVKEHGKQILDYFKSLLQTDEECEQCFSQFESMCFLLIKPIKKFTSDTAKQLCENTENYMKIARKYGYSGTIKWTALSIAELLEPLLMYWETSMIKSTSMCLSNIMLQNVMNLIKHVSIFFIKQTWDKCKCCHSEDCSIRRDIYNAVVLKVRCISLICKLNSNDVTKETCILAREILEQNIASIYEMKESGCKCWAQLWSTCGVLIYNLGILCEKIYEESTLLFSLLCTCIIKFEGVKQKYKYITMQNPISSTLHRLCTIHYSNGMYREAMTAAALNGLMNYSDPNSKAFRMWANIKYKCLSSNKIMALTMVACLKGDKAKIEELGLRINLSEYNLVQLCMREAKGLQEAKVNLSVAIENVLDEMTVLGATAIERAHVLELLEHHLLSFKHQTNTTERLKSSISDLKKFKHNSASIVCMKANLEFYVFVNELEAVSQKTELEMENTKFALYAPKVSEFVENESPDIVPAYTMINIKEDFRLMSRLQRPIKKWTDSFEQDINDIVNGREPQLTLQTIIIAAEYARLYRYESCEIQAWTLAYKLATALQDYRAIIYVTGRIISLRQIKHDWITVAEDLTYRLRDSKDEDTIEAIAVFRISLADYYFESGMNHKGKILLNEARSLPGISFLGNTAVYLYSLDRILWNSYCYTLEKALDHQQYTRYIVETLYAMVSLSDELKTKKCKYPARYLFSFDVLFSTVINLSLRMNSLLSFREICAHLVRRLRTAQALGATIRVAELLKSLCYIDLSRSQLADCEVKLQGLEHILNIEGIESSMNTKMLKVPTEYIMTTPTRTGDPLRDVPHNGGSPMLRKKVFDLPEFLRHTNCECYSCKNTSYHYLIFTSTHIRAQLYALQRCLPAAIEHFHGAFQISTKLVKSPTIPQIWTADFQCDDYSTWQQRFYMVDYVLMLVHFAYFLRGNKHSTEQEVLDVLHLAIKICKKHKLMGHPIYKSLKELILNMRFQRVFSDNDLSSIMVPSQLSIDISKYVEEPKTAQQICKTPVLSNSRPRKPLSIRRNRTPPLFKLTKVSMNYSDDEGSNQSSPVTQRKRTRPQRLTRRKILEEDYTDVANIIKEPSSFENKILERRTRSQRKTDSESTLLKDIVNTVAPVLETPQHLHVLPNNSEELQTVDSVQKITDKMKNLRVDSNANTKEKSARITRKSKQSVTNEQSNKISETVKLFEDMIIEEKPNTTQTPEKLGTTETSIIECTPPQAMKTRRRVLQKQSVKTEENSTGKLSQPVVPFNEYETENKATRLGEIKSTRTRQTRRVIVKKETHNLRTSRKTNEKSL